ncbi:ser thr phosphatase superfamily [Pyrenophora seminiperda CCB06]|uniref:Ser thr phosphatase superfamily n=1 Tax=Pyrenophora seminiperda CCB06 TaxID=1302712 RepID=A0A3M7MFS5_9PLEO|nr:ser thr phosphatase superfamily [Pyrenophora seminiperda CCB06]
MAKATQRSRGSFFPKLYLHYHLNILILSDTMASTTSAPTPPANYFDVVKTLSNRESISAVYLCLPRLPYLVPSFSDTTLSFTNSFNNIHDTSDTDSSSTVCCSTDTKSNYDTALSVTNNPKNIYDTSDNNLAVTNSPNNIYDASEDSSSIGCCSTDTHNTYDPSSMPLDTDVSVTSNPTTADHASSMIPEDRHINQQVPLVKGTKQTQFLYQYMHQNGTSVLNEHHLKLLPQLVVVKMHRDQGALRNEVLFLGLISENKNRADERDDVQAIFMIIQELFMTRSEIAPFPGLLLDFNTQFNAEEERCRASLVCSMEYMLESIRSVLEKNPHMVVGRGLYDWPITVAQEEAEAQAKDIREDGPPTLPRMWMRYICSDLVTGEELDRAVGEAAL